MFIVNWWNAMSAAQHGFLFVAVPATLVLVIQTVMLLIGLGGGDGVDFDGDGIPDGLDMPDGVDLDGDGIPDVHGGLEGDLRVFTVRGFVAFFAVFGWTGPALLAAGMPLWAAIVGAFCAGAVAMILIAMLMRAMLRLQQSGNLDPRNAVGKSGTVYVPVPADRQGSGKVNLVLQERFSELDAVTDGEEIPTGREVTVVGVNTLGTLVVREK